MLRLKKILVLFSVVLFLTQLNFCSDKIASKVKTAIVIDRVLGEFVNSLAMRNFEQVSSQTSSDSGYDSDISDLGGFVIIK